MIPPKRKNYNIHHAQTQIDYIQRHKRNQGDQSFCLYESTICSLLAAPPTLAVAAARVAMVINL